MLYMVSSNAMRKTGKVLRLLLPCLVFAAKITPCQALEPEPGKWNHLPTGQYMVDKLINLGENRFAFRPQVGVLHTRNHWTVEGTAEVAFYTDNDDFFNGKKLEQKPLYILYGNLSYTFRPGQWLSAGVGFDYGGEHFAGKPAPATTRAFAGAWCTVALDLTRNS
jgi:hypothetical protein